MSMVNNNNFDERQILARGKGFQIGFFLALGLIFLNSAFETGIFSIQISIYSRLMFMIFTCITVVSVFFIVKDAYDSINKNRSNVLMIFFTICGLFVLIFMIEELFTGNKMFFENGAVSDVLGQMYYGFCMIVISGVYFVKRSLNKKNFGDEEE